MMVNTRREEYAALTKAAILASARELFVTDGYDKASIDAIAGHARVSKGAVYHHFSDKRSIFEDVLRECVREGRDAVLAHVARLGLDGPNTGREMAVAGAVESLRFFGEDPARRLLMRQGREVLGAERQQQIDEEETLPMVRGIITQLADRGELRQDVPVDLTAELILGLLSTALTIAALADDPDDVLARARAIVTRMIGGLFIDTP